jgi:multicomponent Na+:H+ antiporter subunit D
VAHPALPYLIGALLIAIVPARARRIVAGLPPAVGLLVLVGTPDGSYEWGGLAGQSIAVMRLDGLARSFAIVFGLISTLGAVYAGHVERRRFHVAALVAGAAGLGIVLAGDWITFYVAWETLAIASFVLIVDGGTPWASAAALRYLLVHVLGGSLLLGGLAWVHVAEGPLAVGALDLRGPALLVLLGFAINAAIPPLHAWLTDAYPESSPAAGVLLSAFATKSAVYALARVFAGTEVLLWVGCVMAVWGVVFAMLEDDMRRLLGYHIVSQVGYMVAGIGLGTPLAVNGAVAHAFCHILYKGLLFMATGSVIHATGRRRISALSGLAGSLPRVFVLYMVGALSITGAPLLNGFVSKAMIVAAGDVAGISPMVWMLTVASVGTFLSVGLKLPVLVFGGTSRVGVAHPVPIGMLIAMTVTAGLCVLIGVIPGPLYRLLPYAVTWEPYTGAHVAEVLEVMAGTTVAFVLAKAVIGRKATVTLDFDRAYRRIGRAFLRMSGGVEKGALALEQAAFALVTMSPVQRRVLAGPVGYAVLIAVGSLGLLLAGFLGSGEP